MLTADKRNHRDRTQMKMPLVKTPTTAFVLAFSVFEM